MSHKNQYSVTDETRSRLVVAYKSGASVKDISAEYGVSNSCILRSLHKGKIKVKRPKREYVSKFSHKDILSLNEKGEPVSVISGIIGCSAWIVYNVLKRNGLTPNDPRGAKTKYVKNEIVADYLSGIRKRDICLKYSISISRLIEVLKEKGQSIRKEFRQDKGIEIKRLHSEGKNTKEISGILGITPTQAQHYLSENGIKTNKFYYRVKGSVDDNYFNVIDDEKKAYFLGLLFADGNITSGKKNQIRIALKEQDGYLLRELKSEIKSDCAVARRVFPKNPNWESQISVQFSSKQMKEDLVRYGCTPRKSKTLLFPELPQYYMWHFIRGYFDGDGCICVYTDKWECRRTTVSFSGSVLFNRRLREILIGYGIKCGVREITDTFSNLTISAKNFYVFRDLLYNEATIFMKRKRDKFYE